MIKEHPHPHFLKYMHHTYIHTRNGIKMKQKKRDIKLEKKKKPLTQTKSKQRLQNWKLFTNKTNRNTPIVLVRTKQQIKQKNDTMGDFSEKIWKLSCAGQGGEVLKYNFSVFFIYYNKTMMICYKDMKKSIMLGY